MRIFVSGLILAGAIWAALPGAAQAEGKCSRNADELTGAMISMMPDGSYCEMDDGARKSAEAEIAAYNNQIQVGNRETEAPADGDKSGSALVESNRRKGSWSGTVYSRTFEKQMQYCRKTGRDESACSKSAEQSVDYQRTAAMERCVKRKGMTHNQCRADMENSEYFNYYY